MKTWKRLFIIVIVCFFALPAQFVNACSAFIIGKDLTADGSALYGRTEDYPFPPNSGKHNKNFIINEAKTYKEGDMLEDEYTGFKYAHEPQEYKYLSVPDATRGTGEGIYGAHGFNEYGVSMTGTVTAVPNEKVLEVDPLVEDGLAEAILIDLVLPRVKTAREGIELIGKVVSEKGSAEGNIVVVADKDEIWYMEILSGHQYVAIKFPDDKFAVFPNTYFLGHVDFSDTENVIASSDVEEVARKANSYVERDGQFHIAKSYGPEEYAEGNRSRVYAGIKLLDPDSPIQYEDEVYDLLREPTDATRKYTVEDALAIQRNRFEHLPEFSPDDEIGKVRNGDDDKDKELTPEEEQRYKYALGNENVIDAHVYQIKSDLPASFGGVMWLGLGRTRNAPYIPFYGNITETHESFHPQTHEYDPNSWYWVAQHIDEMVTQYPDLFGKTIQEKWIALEKEAIAAQAALDAKYAGLSEEEAKAVSEEVTADALERAAKLFAEMKALEEEMEQKIKESGQQ